MNPMTFPLFVAESTALFYSRLMFGDEKVNELSEKMLSGEKQAEMVSRHPHQAAGLLRTRLQNIKEKHQE